MPVPQQWREYVYRVCLTLLTEAREDAAAQRRRGALLNFTDLLLSASRLLREDFAVEGGAAAEISLPVCGRVSGYRSDATRTVVPAGFGARKRARIGARRHCGPGRCSWWETPNNPSSVSGARISKCTSRRGAESRRPAGA